MHQPTGDNYALDADGNRVFTEGPPPTTVDAGIMNSIVYEIINAIIASGQTLAEGPGTDLKNQLATAIQRAAAYDAIVYSQETFNAIWERVGANEYKILDTIGSVHFKAYSGGYNMSGPTSPLSDGDTWGRFKTNRCTFIMCDGGNFFQMGDTPSYWEIDSDNTTVYGMDVRGLGVSAVAITKSIYVRAGVTGCVLVYPKVSYRYSSANHYVIQAASEKNKIIGADISYCDNSGNSFFGIFNFEHALQCQIHDLTLSTAAACYGFYSTGQNFPTENCICQDITATGAFTAFTIAVGSANKAETITASGVFTGFVSSTLSACIVQTCASTADTAYGFYGGGKFSGCTAAGISSAAKSAYGFYDCDNVSGCQAYDIETSVASASYKAVGFQDCNQLSACQADTIAAPAANAYAYGFNNCDRVSACHATTVTAATVNRAYGFYGCDWMDGSNEATAIDDFEFYDCSQEPFKGNAAAATPYGYTEVYTSLAVANGSTVTVTPTKDCILFGFIRQPTGGATATVSIRVGNSGKTLDQVVNVAYNYIQYGTFCVPCKGGQSTYFAVVSSANIAFWCREMPFGTTT